MALEHYDSLNQSVSTSAIKCKDGNPLATSDDIVTSIEVDSDGDPSVFTTLTDKLTNLDDNISAINKIIEDKVTGSGDANTIDTLADMITYFSDLAATSSALTAETTKQAYEDPFET